MNIDDLLTLTKEAESNSKKSDSELLKVYTINGEHVGCAPRILCHRLGLIHKVVYCFVVNSEGEILLQVRSEGRLDITIGGHLNSNDMSVGEALGREAVEEIGIRLDQSRLVKLCQYFREGDSKLSKPREINREIRELFLYELNEMELESIDEAFNERLEKNEVVNVQWCTLDEIAKACDTGKSADGLQASYYHYLLWRVRNLEANDNA
ncbi:MAG: NUDIX domain-containing protein [Oceanospirillaceae bacterium]|nr:NUDIX domain-containing protein [Oceanospirillaceae bacterium]